MPNHAPPPPPSSAAPNPEPAHPAIRTMSSDIDELLKTSTPTASQMIGKETPFPERLPPEMPKARRRGMGPVVIVIGILAIGGLIGGGIWYFLPTTSRPVTSQTNVGVVGTLQTPSAPVPVPPPKPAAIKSTSQSATASANSSALS